MSAVCHVERSRDISKYSRNSQRFLRGFDFAHHRLSVGMTRNRRSQTAATVQSAGTTAPAFQVDASPGAHPSSSARTCIRLSSLTDREFRGLHSEALVKSKSRLGAMLPPTQTAHDRALRHVQDSSPISMALSFRYRRYRS